MARWAVRHSTVYHYDSAVTFAPHVLRLTPRADTTRLLTRQLRIQPEPVDWREQLDDFGNSCTHLSFGTAAAQELRVESYVEVETLELPRAHGATVDRLPWALPHGGGNDERSALQHPDVKYFAFALAERANYEPFVFLEQLAHELHSRTDRQIRLDGAAQAPEQTLASARGACRDLSVLYLAACRSVGMSCRFVSGYQGQEQTPDGRRHLHAWAEVLLPGGGIVGWDPMHGVPVGSGHIALAAAPEQAPTMPIEGGYFFSGPCLTSTLDYSIEMHAL